MKKELERIKNDSLIGIYIFDEARFDIGKILKISEKYLFLKSYNTEGEVSGIKLFSLDTIERVVVESEYINNLTKNKINKFDTSISSFNNIFSDFIKDKTVLSIKLENGTSEIGILKKKEDNLFFFEFLDDNYKVNSKEIIYADNIEKISILEKYEKDFKIENIKKVKFYNGNEYEGNILYENKEYILLQEMIDLSHLSYFSVIATSKIESITDKIIERMPKKIDEELLFKNIKLELKEILKLVKNLNLVVMIDNINFDKSKVGTIISLDENKLKLKEFDENYNFTEISEIYYDEIEILSVKNLCF